MPERHPLRDKLHDIIFETDTRAGRIFEFFIITCIILSVIVVMLITVKSINEVYGELLYGIEWFFTLLFTIEYLLRLYCVRRHVRYATSFFGIIDFLAVIPTYIRFFFPGPGYLIFIRILRVLRILRILKILPYIGDANLMMLAFRRSSRKIIVFLFTIVASVVILGSIMYVIEAKAGSGFTSIPESVYWAVVTLTTVGYGDISPVTPLGQFVASVIMVLGYSIIAVPSGIVTVEMTRIKHLDLSNLFRTCPSCNAKGHEDDASFCKFCGAKLQRIA